MKYLLSLMISALLIGGAPITGNLGYANTPDPCAKLSVTVKRSTDSEPLSGINVEVTNWRGQSAFHTTNVHGQIILDSTNSSTNPVLTNTGYSSGRGKCARAVPSGRSFNVTVEAIASGFTGGSGKTTLTYSDPNGKITIYLSPQSRGHGTHHPSSGPTEIVVEVVLPEKAHYVYLEEVDGIKSSHWNPNGRYPVRTGDVIEREGKFIYVINTIYPGIPKKVTGLGMLYKFGDMSQSRQRDVNLNLIKKWQVNVAGNTYYDVMYAKFIE